MADLRAGFYSGENFMHIDLRSSLMRTSTALALTLLAGSARAGVHPTTTAHPAPVTTQTIEAPPPLTEPTPVPVPVVVERARLLFFGLQLGPSFSFGCCTSAGFGGFGFWGNGIVGLAFTNGLSVAAVIGARANYFSRTGSSSIAFLDVTLGARIRYSLMHGRRFHPFFQISGDAHLGSGSSTNYLFGVGPGAGFEFEFGRHFSAEIGVKADVIFPLSGATSSAGLEFAILPFIGFNYYR